jgi:hypothetical protein
VSYADPEGHQERKEFYEDILRVVDYHPGEGFTAGMRLGPLVSNRTRAGYELDAIEKAVSAARENDDLLQYTDHEGRQRVTLTDDESLLDVIEAEAQRENPNQELIARCNALRTDTEDGQ